MKAKACFIPGIVLLLCQMATGQTTADCHFTNFDVPRSVFSSVSGINNAGVLAGTFGDQQGNVRGFIFRSHTFTTFEFPGSNRTETGQINNKDWVVGDYIDGKTFVQKGFLLQNGRFSTVFVPGARSTLAEGINDQGVIVGTFTNGSGEHGFVKIDNHFVTINFPGASRTSARGINDAGDITGTYGDEHGGNHAFLLRNGHFSSFDFPGTSGVTSGLGISPTGIIVGNYFPGTGHGFILNHDYDGDDFETADFPGGSQSTIPFDMNASQVMVGSYVSAAGQNHGFVAHCEVLPSR